jgi:hypothetical protein
MKKDNRGEMLLTSEERQWKRQFAALAKFRRKHGHCLVSRKRQGNSRLAKWVAEQRAMRRRGKLRSDRFRRLEQLGFAWNYQDGLWDRQFTELKAYRRLHGHCQVPARSKEYPSLGNWVHFQRVQKRAGCLSAKRARRLKQIGFDWISRGRLAGFRDSTYWETKWERMLSALVKFKGRFGHCRVPAGRSGDPTLRGWVSRQRKLKRQGLLRKDRRRRLEALGFDWRPAASANLRWERCFQRLAEFHRRFGHCHVPAEWAENRTLGGWVVKTRMLRRTGRLSADKVRRLDKIGFVWDATAKRRAEHDAVWSKWLAQLIAFRRKHGHLCVPTDQRKFHRLRVWMDNQRISYHRGWLSEDRIRRLEMVRFPWLSDRGLRLSSEA